MHSEECTTDPLEQIRKFTPDVDPTTYEDGNSQLLYAQWKGQSGKELLPLLKKRVRSQLLKCDRIVQTLYKFIFKKSVSTLIHTHYEILTKKGRVDISGIF